MKAERWQEIEKLFERAADLPAEERRLFLERQAGDDTDLLREVESLLSADERSEDFLEQPALPDPIPRLLELHPGFDDRGRIGPYRLLRKLGEGGMSRVYLAVRDDDEYQKLVAVKVIRQGMNREDLLRRFRTERQILAALDHPNIARLLDGGTTDTGLPYFVMEHIEGLPILEYCDRHRLPIRDRLEIFRTVCTAVQYAHQNLVVHRDIKASNILVTNEGAPKLLDFGIAKLLKPDQFPVRVEFTATGLRPMTPYYASPEQIQGKSVNTATDVYSLGVLLYKLLTGHFPYHLQQGTAREVEQAVLEEEPEPPSTALTRVETVLSEEAPGVTISPDTVAEARRAMPAQLRRQLAGDLDTIVLAALRKEPQRRYPSVDAFSEDIHRFLEGLPVLAHRDSVGYRARKFVKRHRIGVGVTALVTLMLIGFAVAMGVQASRLAHERDQAQLDRDRAEQVITFLQDIFQISDPIEGEGATITAREILDRGARRVTNELQDQPEVQATLMEAIGNVYRNLALYDFAEPLLRRSLELRRSSLGEDHPAVAQSLNNLAVVMRTRGRMEEAASMFRQALELRRRLFGDMHPLVAESLNNMGHLYQELGEFQRAEAHYREALAIERNALGPFSPELAVELSNLGMLLNEMGDAEAAEPLFREALEIRRQALGEEHPLVAESLNNLGVFLAIRGDLEAAEPLLLESLELRRKVLGDEHIDVAESYNNLGRLSRELGKFDEAEALLRQGLELRNRVAGPDDPYVSIYRNNLADMLLDLGELDKAEPLFRQVLETRRRVLGPRHFNVAISLRGLGKLLVERGRPLEAERHLREALDIAREALPADHWRIAEMETYLGECLASQGRFEEAEPLLVEGYERFRTLRQPEDRRVRAALDRLVRLYELWGRPEEAARFAAGSSG